MAGTYHQQASDANNKTSHGRTRRLGVHGGDPVYHSLEWQVLTTRQIDVFQKHEEGARRQLLRYGGNPLNVQPFP